MIKHIHDLFATFRKIFCLCPNCDQVFHLSDAAIVDLKKAHLVDWLGDLEIKKETLVSKIDRAEERLDKKREALKEIEQKNAHRRSNKIINNSLPFFYKLKVNPQDVKTILHPVNFVCFDGYFNEEVKKIRFIDQKAFSKQEEQIQKQLDDTIAKKNYQWVTVRIGEQGELERE
jgi:predicted Holliday junction resolvase-like endonuclease